MSDTVAVAIAVFDTVKQSAYRSHLQFAAEMSRRLPKQNIWWLEPAWERRTYPFCVNDMVGEMMARENLEGHMADWFFWLEDDIVPDPDVYFKLLEAADPVERPFVAALAQCRTRPFWPGVADIIEQAGVTYVKQWADAPKSGVHPADRIGMCASLFHRSLFDIIVEPWFAVDVSSYSGVGPDSFWCSRLLEHGIQPYLCCDTKVGHIGTPPIVTQEMSERWNEARMAKPKERA